jgi:hypothetical protein
MSLENPGVAASRAAVPLHRSTRPRRNRTQAGLSRDPAATGAAPSRCASAVFDQHLSHPETRGAAHSTRDHSPRAPASSTRERLHDPEEEHRKIISRSRTSEPSSNRLDAREPVHLTVAFDPTPPPDSSGPSAGTGSASSTASRSNEVPGSSGQPSDEGMDLRPGVLSDASDPALNPASSLPASAAAEPSAVQAPGAADEPDGAGGGPSRVQPVPSSVNAFGAAPADTGADLSPDATALPDTSTVQGLASGSLGTAASSEMPGASGLEAAAGPVIGANNGPGSEMNGLIGALRVAPTGTPLGQHGTWGEGMGDDGSSPGDAAPRNHNGPADQIPGTNVAVAGSSNGSSRVETAVRGSGTVRDPVREESQAASSIRPGSEHGRAESSPALPAPGTPERGATHPVAEVVSTASSRTPAVLMAHLPARVAQIAAGLGESGSRVVRLRLDPPALGEIRVHVESSSQGIAVRIVAQSHEACALLSDHQAELGRELSRQGLALQSFSASLAGDAGGDRAAGSEQSPFERRSTDRRSSVAASVSEAVRPGPAVRRTGNLDTRV